MLERILIPVDGSVAAEAIVPYLERLLRRRESRLTLLRVVPPVPAYPGLDPARMVETDRVESRKYVEELARRLEREGARVGGRTLEGLEAEMILQAAREEKATMIAMTTHGRTGLARWAMGSVAEKVVRAADVPVLLVRSFHGAVPLPPGGIPVRRILLPVDGSDLAAAALPPVMEFAALLDAEVAVLHVQPEFTPLVFAHPGASVVAPPSPSPEAVTAPIVEKLRSAGLRARAVGARGDAPSHILDAVQSERADMIALSSHGRSGLSRWMLGSVAEKVLRASTVPMLIVRGSAAGKAVAAA